MDLTLQPADGDLVRVACVGQIMQYQIPPGTHSMPTQVTGSVSDGRVE